MSPYGNQGGTQYHRSNWQGTSIMPAAAIKIAQRWYCPKSKLDARRATLHLGAGNSAGFGGLAPVASTGTGGMGSRRSMASIGSIRGSRAIPMGMGGMPGMGMQGLGGMGGMHPGFGMGIMGSPMMGLPMGMQQFGAMGTPPMMMLSNSYLTMQNPPFLPAIPFSYSSPYSRSAGERRSLISTISRIGGRIKLPSKFG